jgi:hypothetical protein
MTWKAASKKSFSDVKQGTVHNYTVAVIDEDDSLFETTPLEEMSPLRLQSSSNKRGIVLGSICITLFTTVFALLWWNKYLGITNDGWHFFHAQRILSGEMPYRDFYLFIPPLHPLRIAAEISLFGNYLIVPQIFGLLERIILFVVLFVWLCRFFPIKYSLVGVLTGAVLYLSDYSESLSSLHHEAVFWATLAAFCLGNALANEKRRNLWCIASGLLAGLAFLGKQTSGLGISLSVPAYLFFALYKDGWRLAAKNLAAFATGFAIPAVAVFSWLAAHQALSAFIEQIFLKGPTSKGSLSQLLLRPLAMTLEEPYMRRTAFLAVVIVLAIAFFIQRNKQKFVNADFALPITASNRQVIAVTASAFLALVAGLLLSHYSTPSLQSYFAKMVEQLPMYISQIGIIALLIYFAQLFVRGKLDREQTQIGAFVFTGSAIVLTLSFSWSVYVSMLIPALPFLIALTLSRLANTKVMLVARVAVLAACALFVSVTTWHKLERPYNWAHWIEANVSRATESSALPELAGLQMSPATKARVERIVGLIQAHSSETEPVFVYPHLPIFYILSHRRPNTFTNVHFFDVTPDYVARQDAERLLQNPPAVIVDFEFTAEQIADNETLFRGGARSGQRDITEAIHQLTKDYDLLETYQLPKGNVIRVWAKKK